MVTPSLLIWQEKKGDLHSKKGRRGILGSRRSRREKDAAGDAKGLAGIALKA